MPMGPALFVVKPVLPAPYLERLFLNGPLVLRVAWAALASRTLGQRSSISQTESSIEVTRGLTMCHFRSRVSSKCNHRRRNGAPSSYSPGSTPTCWMRGPRLDTLLSPVIRRVNSGLSACLMLCLGAVVQTAGLNAQSRYDTPTALWGYQPQRPGDRGSGRSSAGPAASGLAETPSNRTSRRATRCLSHDHTVFVHGVLVTI